MAPGSRTLVQPLKDWATPADLRDHVLEIGKQVYDLTPVYMDGEHIGDVRRERSSPRTPRAKVGSRRGDSPITHWYVDGDSFYTRTEAVWELATRAL